MLVWAVPRAMFFLFGWNISVIASFYSQICSRKLERKCFHFALQSWWLSWRKRGQVLHFTVMMCEGHPFSIDRVSLSTFGWSDSPVMASMWSEATSSCQRCKADSFPAYASCDNEDGSNMAQHRVASPGPIRWMRHGLENLATWQKEASWRTAHSA